MAAVGMRRTARRQQVRQGILLATFLLFPLIYYYLSPYLIIESALLGIVNGSFLLFAALFLSALVFGRAWCGWVCPAAGVQEACTLAQSKPARGGRLNWIKWGIWGIWIGAIGWAAYTAGGYRRVDPFYPNGTWVSIVEPMGFITYYVVAALVVALALSAGRRAFCHYVCWMAPFMVLGRKAADLGAWPSLRLRPQPAQCTGCDICTRQCPMSLDVKGMVLGGRMESSECILCGTCVDVCPKDAIGFRYATARSVRAAPAADPRAAVRGRRAGAVKPDAGGSA